MKQHHSATSTAKRAPQKRVPDASVLEQGAKSPEAVGSSEAREKMVQEAAYRYYVARGYVHGHALHDWLMAEAEVDRTLAADANTAESQPPTN